MKDPFQSEPTPYEVLGLECSAASSDIDTAFKAGLVRGGNVQKLTAAKLALQRPAERAAVDLFLYDDGVLARLSPNALENRAVLDSANRLSTAAAWEAELRGAFPDLPVAHSLAVLWYWQALEGGNHPQGRAAAAAAGAADGAEAAAAADPAHAWRRAIACWVMLLASPDFWSTRPGVSNEVMSQVRTGIAERLQNRLHDLGQQCRGGGDAAGAARFQELELAFSTEMQAAKQIALAGVKTARGRICCGPLMLEQMDIVAAVRDQMETALNAQPDNEALRSALRAISPHASIAVLIDQKKPQAALDAIAALPPKVRKKQEVAALEARALHELARQRAALNKQDEALEAWGKALPLARKAAPELAASIQADLVETCQARAAALQMQNRDEAIGMLGRALTVHKDPKLQLTLAELLTTRGIETINEAQRRIESEKGTSPAIMTALETGLADLDRAQELGSKRGAASAETALKIIEQARAGYLDLAGEAAELFRQANQAAEAGDFGRGIEMLLLAHTRASPKSQPAIAKHLAQLLNARAVQSMNAAMNTLNEAMPKHQPRVEAEVAKLLKRPWTKNFMVSIPMYGKPPDCDLCAASASYSYELPVHGKYNLCSSHADRLRGLMNSLPKLPAETAKQVDAAVTDLEHAVKWDPSLDVAKKNLEQAKELQKRIKDAVSLGPEMTGFKAVSGWVLNLPWFLIAGSLLTSNQAGARGLGVVMAVVFFVFLLLRLFTK